MNQIKFINFDNVSDEEASTFRTREAARAIVFEDEVIALLYSEKGKYYKLPGGGGRRRRRYTRSIKTRMFGRDRL